VPVQFREFLNWLLDVQLALLDTIGKYGRFLIFGTDLSGSSAICGYARNKLIDTMAAAAPTTIFDNVGFVRCSAPHWIALFTLYPLMLLFFKCDMN